MKFNWVSRNLISMLNGSQIFPFHDNQGWGVWPSDLAVNRPFDDFHLGALKILFDGLPPHLKKSFLPKKMAESGGGPLLRKVCQFDPENYHPKGLEKVFVVLYIK